MIGFKMAGIYRATNESTGKVGSDIYLCKSHYQDLEGRLAGTLAITLMCVSEDSDHGCERCTQERKAEDIY